LGADRGSLDGTSSNSSFKWRRAISHLRAKGPVLRSPKAGGRAWSLIIDVHLSR
jgi:hypothetical protein